MSSSDEAACDSDEGDLLGFAPFAKTLVDGAQDRVMLGGGEGNHVEDAAHLGPPLLDEAPALLPAAVTGMRSEPG